MLEKVATPHLSSLMLTKEGVATPALPEPFEVYKGVHNSPLIYPLCLRIQSKGEDSTLTPPHFAIYFRINSFYYPLLKFMEGERELGRRITEEGRTKKRGKERKLRMEEDSSYMIWRVGQRCGHLLGFMIADSRSGGELGRSGEVFAAAVVVSCGSYCWLGR